MNEYTVEFFAVCPNNGIRIKYLLCIETQKTIEVEQIIDDVMLLNRGYHEEIADQLQRIFGGKQTMIADHHGVIIKTTRGA